MALAPGYLLDKSAQARQARPEVLATLEPLVRSGQIATCGVIELEVLFSARSYTDFVQIRGERALAFTMVPIVQTDFDRAIEVMELLSRRGQHRAVKLPDLLIATIAERSGLTVLHYDADYDLIGTATGQPVQWVVPRGSVP